jgi:hypothetical protein
MGLESYPDYRPTGRLGYCHGNPPLSDPAFAVLQTLVKCAAENIEQFDREHADALDSRGSHLRVLMSLCRATLDDLASDDRADGLTDIFG